ncbi:hypothetical protein D3C71_1614910 [compost metagenome]
MNLQIPGLAPCLVTQGLQAAARNRSRVIDQNVDIDQMLTERFLIFTLVEFEVHTRHIYSVFACKKVTGASD